MAERARSLVLAPLLALVLALGSTVAVSMHARMVHGEDCDMPTFARGAPTILSTPAAPPTPVLAPAPSRATLVVADATHQDPTDSDLPGADRCRGPPSA